MSTFIVGIKVYQLYPAIKNVIDRIGAVSLLFMVGFPVFLLGIINALIDRKPIFFTQARIGKDGASFTLFKLRSMRDGEVTPFGRFLRRWSFDEIPQLVNIIRGEMSFVGPRPLLLEYRKHYTEQQNRRHEVLPGITGLSQVNGRNTLVWEQRFMLDVEYVDHQSFWLDLKILIKTIKQLGDRKAADHHAGSLRKFSQPIN